MAQGTIPGRKDAVNRDLKVIGTPPSMTAKQCQKLFATYNQRFFGERLPFYRIVVSDRFGTGFHGLCRKKEREIHLGTSLKGMALKRVLLHEMAHAATKGAHSKEWLAEMTRLAKMGAPTDEDLRVYQAPDQTIGLNEIAAQFYDAGVQTDWTWKKARVTIGRQYGLADDRGRSESKNAAATLRRFRREFAKGRRFRIACG